MIEWSGHSLAISPLHIDFARIAFLVKLMDSLCMQGVTMTEYPRGGNLNDN
jgi:hypothetical protein